MAYSPQVGVRSPEVAIAVRASENQSNSRIYSLLIWQGCFVIHTSEFLFHMTLLGGALDINVVPAYKFGACGSSVWLAETT